MKKLDLEKIIFYAVWWSGIISLSLVGIWLLYQILTFLKMVFYFVLDKINPVFGITGVAMMFVLMLFYGNKQNCAE